MNDERFTASQLWIIGWFLMASAVFLCCMSFALNEFHPVIYKTVFAFSATAFVTGVAVLITGIARG